MTPVAPTATPAPASPTVVVAPPVTIAGDSARGKMLIAEKGCIACHGALGEGGYGPRIAGTSLPFEAVLEQIRRPREFMLAFSAEELSDSGARDIYAYLQELGR
ncbi:MAG TPA: cytochrome c [Chloroflexota bacterium]|nr:cytochrome c [Chloroflexota bacterium]